MEWGYRHVVLCTKSAAVTHHGSCCFQGSPNTELPLRSLVQSACPDRTPSSQSWDEVRALTHRAFPLCLLESTVIEVLAY